MNRVFLSILLCLTAIVPSAFGLSGGPFGNDSPLSTGGSGTYQGVMSGKNLLGITIFLFSESGGSIGNYVVFSEGVVRTGNVQSYVDFPGREIFGILDGDSSSGAFEAHINTTAPIVMATGEGEFAHGGPPSNVSTTVETTAGDVNKTTATIDSDTITVSSKTNDSEGDALNETSVSTSNADTTTITSKTNVGDEEFETVITTENPRSGPEAVEQFEIRLSRTSVVVPALPPLVDGSGDNGSDASGSDGGGSSDDGSGSDSSQNGA